MVSPGIADTAYDRGTAQPSSQRKHWPGYWPAGGEAQARIGLPHQESPFSIREMASEQRGPILAAASAHHLDPAELARWIDPIVRGWMRLLRAVLPLSAIRCWAALPIT